MKKILSVVIATSLVLMSGLPAPFVGREKAYAAAPLAPTNLQITTVEENNRSLTLKWDKSGIGIDSFNVYVDGEFITSVPNNPSSPSISVTLSDDENTMGKLHEPGEHTISVSSVNTNGEESSKVSIARAALLYVNKLPYNNKTYISPSGITVQTRYVDYSLGQGEWYVDYKYDGIVKYLPTGETVNVFDILGFSNADDWDRYRIVGLTNSGKVIIYEDVSGVGANRKYYVYDIVNNVFTPITAYEIVANPVDDTALVIKASYDSTKGEFYLTNLQLINLSNPTQVIKNITSFPPNYTRHVYYKQFFKIIGNKIYGVFYIGEKYLWHVHDGAGWTRINELSIYPQYGNGHQASSPIITAPNRFIYKIDTETDQINVVGQVPTNVNHVYSVYNLMQGDVWYGEGKEEGGSISYLWTLDNPYPTISLNTNVIHEDAVNDGSINEKIIITLSNGTFAHDVVNGVTVNNLPAGLSADVVRTSDTSLEISFTGYAINHANADDVANVELVIDKSKVTGAADNLRAVFGIDFLDPYASISLDKNIVREDAANDGSITEKVTITLSNGTFASDVISGITVDNVPAGLIVDVVRVSDTQLEISFDGRATAHENTNDVSNVQVTIAKEKVTGAVNDLVAVFGIDFIDPYATISLNRTTIQEATENDGSVTEKLVVTVTNGTFTPDIVSGVNVTNLPNGLTANITRLSDTQLEISFVGKATNHASVDSVSNVQVTIDQTKVTGANGTLTATFAIQFADPVPLDMPTLRTQESTSHSVMLEINPVNGATVYKVKRQDSGVVQTLDDVIFQDDTVLPARQYTYEFWAENGEESPHNTVTLWTKPAEPSLQVANVSDNSVVLTVDLKDNPADIAIEARREGGNPIVNGTEISESGLEPNTSYTYEVRLKSANNEYTAWVSKTVQTIPDPFAPTYDTVKDVTVDMGNDGEVDIGGIKNPNDQLRYSIVVKKSGNVIATSPLFSVITELEDWLEGQLERNTKYEIIFGAQKGSDTSTRVEKTIVLITPPAFVTEDNVSVTVTEESATIDLTQVGNPVDTVYEVTVGSQNVTGSNTVTIHDLASGTTYTANVKVNRPDNTLMLIGTVTFKTQGEAVVTPPPVSQPSPDEPTPEEKFKEEVEQVAATFEYVVDGEPNSGLAYIEMQVGASSLTVTATVDEKTANISTTPVRIDKLEDNEEYILTVTFTNGQFTEQREYSITTPNRTPPRVENAFLSDQEIVLEVISKNGLKDGVKE
ncbi:hypothetical protein [Brevibacillus marinus]|uniref:hypothetical protein n=1 Tax=Brevibacillus marinus TaxID=2496837 RepID=UPI000F838DC0|nr:hypothetical protein [Brevibacillus marinus]